MLALHERQVENGDLGSCITSGGYGVFVYELCCKEKGMDERSEIDIAFSEACCICVRYGYI